MVFLIVLAVCVLAEVLVSMKRGPVKTILRAVIWVVCVCLMASRVIGWTRDLLVGMIDKSSGSLSAAMEGIVRGLGLESDAALVARPLAGLTLSLAVPFAFAIGFLGLKFVSWLIYLLVANVCKPLGKIKLFKGVSVVNKLIAAVLGALIGIYSLALITMPITGLARRASGQQGDTSITSIIERVAASDKIRDTFGVSEKLVLVATKATDELSDSITETVFTATGARLISDAFYNSLSKIRPSVISDAASTDSVEYYSFPDVVCEILNLTPKALDVVEVYEKDVIDNKLVDAIEPLAQDVVQTKILSGPEKLVFTNKAIVLANDVIAENMELDPGVKVIHEYADFDTFVGDMDHIFDVVRIFINCGVMSGDADYLDVLSNRETTEALVDAVLAMTTGSDVTSVLVDQAMANLAGTKIQNYVNTDFISNVEANKDAVVDSLMILGELVEYTDADKKTKLDQNDANKKIEELEDLGVITKDAVSVAQKIIGDFT